MLKFYLFSLQPTLLNNKSRIQKEEENTQAKRIVLQAVKVCKLYKQLPNF